MADPSPLRDGRNDPSPVSRVLILGYSDGATDGVIEFGTGGSAYRFEMVDGTRNPDGLDTRTYELRPLPPGSVDRLAGAIGAYIPPGWPVWAPVWRFPSAAARQAVEGDVDAVLSAAGSVEWRITTADPIGFRHLTADRVAAPTAARSAG